MSISEQFTAGMGTILGIQASPQSGITDLTVVDIHINQSNLAPERTGTVLLSVDGVLYRITFRFADEAFDQRTQEGYTKRRNPKARLR
jgi:hypothetical protein